MRSTDLPRSYRTFRLLILALTCAATVALFVAAGSAGALAMVGRWIAALLRLSDSVWSTVG